MVLNNRRMYADLRSKLLLGDIDRQRRLQLQWRKGLDTWKQIHIDAAVNKFQYDPLLYMLTSCHSSPAFLKVLKFSTVHCQIQGP